MQLEPFSRYGPDEDITDETIHCAVDAVLVPESGAILHCTVVVVRMGNVGPPVVVAVERGEHHVVVITEGIMTGVTRIP